MLLCYLIIVLFNNKVLTILYDIKERSILYDSTYIRF